MDAALKKGVVLLVVVFIGYFLFTDPSGLATTTGDAASALWDGLVKLFDAVIRFLNTLLNS